MTRFYGPQRTAIAVDATPRDASCCYACIKAAKSWPNITLQMNTSTLYFLNLAAAHAACWCRSSSLWFRHVQVYSHVESIRCELYALQCESKKLDIFSFEHNFRKYCQILIILSPLQTEIICPQTHRLIEFPTPPIVCCCTTLNNATAYTSSKKL